MLFFSFSCLVLSLLTALLRCASSIIANVICLCHGIAIGWLSPNLPKLEASNSPLESGPLTLSEKSWVREISFLILLVLFYYFLFEHEKVLIQLTHTRTVQMVHQQYLLIKIAFILNGCLDWKLFFHWRNSWQLCLWYSIELCWTKEYTLHIGTTKSGKKNFCLFCSSVPPLRIPNFNDWNWIWIWICVLCIFFVLFLPLFLVF